MADQKIKFYLIKVSPDITMRYWMSNGLPMVDFIFDQGTDAPVMRDVTAHLMKSLVGPFDKKQEVEFAHVFFHSGGDAIWTMALNKFRFGQYQELAASLRFHSAPPESAKIMQMLKKSPPPGTEHEEWPEVS